MGPRKDSAVVDRSRHDLVELSVDLQQHGSSAAGCLENNFTQRVPGQRALHRLKDAESQRLQHPDDPFAALGADQKVDVPHLPVPWSGVDRYRQGRALDEERLQAFRFELAPNPLEEVGAKHIGRTR